MVARLIAAKQEGLEVAFPLLDSQGAAGATVVDGAGQSGKTLLIRGGTPGYFCKEGYWLSIENGDGQHYLHNVKTGGRFDGSGELSITLNEALRYPFADGDTVHLGKPMVQGFIEGDEWAWRHSVDRVIPIEFTLEEYE
jgi:hypothetical protein